MKESLAVVLAFVGILLIGCLSCVGVDSSAGKGEADQGKTYYVDKNSAIADDNNPGTEKNPWKTISRATREQEPCPKPGDTVIVRKGTYLETVDFKIGGSKDKPLQVMAAPGEDVVINSGRPQGIRIKSKGNVVVKGFTVQMSSTGIGVEVEQNGVTLEKNHIIGGERGIFFQNTRGIKIIDCEIEESSAGGIICWSESHEVEIKGCKIHDIGKDIMGDGISLRTPKYRVIQCVGGIEIKDTPNPGLKLFRVKDSKTNKHHGFNDRFMKNYALQMSGQNDEGTEQYPAVLLAFYSEKPSYLDDKTVPGGTAEVGVLYKGFMLRANPEWKGRSFSEEWHLAEIKDSDVQELLKAKCFFIYQHYPKGAFACENYVIENNHVWHTGRQGILLTGLTNVLVRDNLIHNVGATGIQVENGCDNFWLEGNVTHSNSMNCRGETGIWIYGLKKGVVQNNRIYGNTIGLWINKSWNIVARWNTVFENSAQHVNRNMNEHKLLNQTCAQGHSSGLVVCGHETTLQNFFDVPWITDKIAVTGNVFYKNGHRNSAKGAGVNIGVKGWSPVKGTLFLNNVVANNRGKIDVLVTDMDSVMDGNLYVGEEKITIAWENENSRLESAGISSQVDVEFYKKESKQDTHSSFVLGADFGDGKIQIPPSVPLAHAKSDGSGDEVEADRTFCFSEGLSDSKGKRLILGDDIKIGEETAQIVRIDGEKNLIKVDKKMKWRKNDPICYVTKQTGAKKQMSGAKNTP